MTHNEIKDIEQLDSVTGGNSPKPAERMICQHCGQRDGDFTRVPREDGTRPDHAYCDSCGAEYDFSLGNYKYTWGK